MIKKYRNLKEKRKVAIKAKINGTSLRPRLSVFRSNKYLYCQLIDDEKKVTLLSFTNKVNKNDKLPGKTKIEQSKSLGKVVAEKALIKGIKQIVFDRSGYRYHGRVKALAEGAREGGLKF